MPILQVQSSAKPANESDFVLSLSSLVANLLGKPEKYVMVQYQNIPAMCMGGTSDPSALLQLTSIGKLGTEENKTYSESLCNAIHENLKVDIDRIYIFFSDMPRDNIGWNKTTFA